MVYALSAVETYLSTSMATPASPLSGDQKALMYQAINENE